MEILCIVILAFLPAPPQNCPITNVWYPLASVCLTNHHVQIEPLWRQSRRLLETTSVDFHLSVVPSDWKPGGVAGVITLWPIPAINGSIKPQVDEKPAALTPILNISNLSVRTISECSQSRSRQHISARWRWLSAIKCHFPARYIKMFFSTYEIPQAVSFMHPVRVGLSKRQNVRVQFICI